MKAFAGTDTLADSARVGKVAGFLLARNAVASYFQIVNAGITLNFCNSVNIKEENVLLQTGGS